MPVRFCVLGSGSRGNATLVQASGTQVLIDAGFPPDEIARRLSGAAASWSTLSAVLLTHTHSDHLYRRCLKEMLLYRVPLHCHRDHVHQLEHNSHFGRLRKAGLVRTFSARGAFEVSDGLRFSPLCLPHDCPPTFGFLIEARTRSGRVLRLAYLADLGHCPAALLKKIRPVDLLALEFNHDEAMERRSCRPADLVDRVLGPHGHLSNVQAAAVLEQVLLDHGGPRKLIQLHLSEECNDRKLAYAAALEVVRRLGADTEIFSSHQHCPGTVHHLD